MSEATHQTKPIKFPKQGSNWKPLPKGKEANRVKAHSVQTINATPEQIFNLYTRIELLPTWQDGVVAVERTGAHTLHWKMQDPGTSKQFEFDSEEVEVFPGRRHVSRVTSGPTAGSTDTLTLEQHPAGRGTIATLVSDYTVPGSWLTSAVSAVISRSPAQMTVENLRHLKELAEAGEIPTVEGQPAGRRNMSAKLERFLLGENLPTPPGTRESARPEDMPKGRSGGFFSKQRIATVGVIAAPLILGAVAWNRRKGQ